MKERRFIANYVLHEMDNYTYNDYIVYKDSIYNIPGITKVYVYMHVQA